MLGLSPRGNGVTAAYGAPSIAVRLEMPPHRPMQRGSRAEKEKEAAAEKSTAVAVRSAWEGQASPNRAAPQRAGQAEPKAKTQEDDHTYSAHLPDARRMLEHMPDARRSSLMQKRQDRKSSKRASGSVLPGWFGMDGEAKEGAGEEEEGPGRSGRAVQGGDDEAQAGATSPQQNSSRALGAPGAGSPRSRTVRDGLLGVRRLRQSCEAKLASMAEKRTLPSQSPREARGANRTPRGGTEEKSAPNQRPRQEEPPPWLSSTTLPILPASGTLSSLSSLLGSLRADEARAQRGGLLYCSDCGGRVVLGHPCAPPERWKGGAQEASRVQRQE